MRHVALPALLLAVLVPCAPAPGARTSPLETVRLAAALKGEEIGLGGKPPTREKRALGKALSRLDRQRTTLLDDLRAAGPVCRLLDGAFPGDVLLDPALEGALDDLDDEALVERAALLAWMGRTGSDRGESRLEHGIQNADGYFVGADGAGTRTERAGLLLRAATTLERTRQALHLDAPKPGPPPFEGVAPDFTLADINPSSATTGLPISPRGYLGKISAWYFIHTT